MYGWRCEDEVRGCDAGAGDSHKRRPGAPAWFVRVVGIGFLGLTLAALPVRAAQPAALRIGNATASIAALRADESGPVIVLDPGHSGTDISSVDPATGLLDHDYPNDPEMAEVFWVALQAQAQLEADGYTVILTKASVDDTVSLRQRAEIANQAGAALAVSIHDDHGASWDTFAQVYVQRVGLYRTTASGEQITFTDAAVAEQSQASGALFAEARTAAEGRPATVSSISFDGRAGIAPGNIPLVELFATVPWVYNEVGADGPGPLSDEKLAAYAQGIVMGVEAAVPLGIQDQ